MQYTDESTRFTAVGGFVVLGGFACTQVCTAGGIGVVLMCRCSLRRLYCVLCPFDIDVLIVLSLPDKIRALLADSHQRRRKTRI